ncbi:hypothetical protein Srot_2798 [Segniliparus rotundus DSM 44985]|uniref:Uncharacterized protein n=1 Tax=Segniliparus rotundus (strain ATCC BAA-972 / CDC 1076 / CIP 108378 / DSM 44985 / JCM 13578) TaxID=640132 RepID=D6ZD43_SEGRD|nr:hypothetical protein [Segniliparus rotundus]ADG99230.1 hypothetical protein Srot_2798 [Segniliparus rotundus DSM 44985]
MSSDDAIPVEWDYKDFGAEGLLQPELCHSHGGAGPILPLLPPSPPGQSSLVMDDDPLAADTALEGPNGRVVVRFAHDI